MGLRFLNYGPANIILLVNGVLLERSKTVAIKVRTYCSVNQDASRWFWFCTTIVLTPFRKDSGTDFFPLHISATTLHVKVVTKKEASLRKGLKFVVIW